MYVYFIKAGEFTKIGKANDPQKRLAELQTGIPVTLELMHTIKSENPFELEKSLHEKYSTKRVRGEWFRLDDDDYADILEPVDMTPEEKVKVLEYLKVLRRPELNPVADWFCYRSKIRPLNRYEFDKLYISYKQWSVPRGATPESKVKFAKYLRQYLDVRNIPYTIITYGHVSYVTTGEY